MTPFAILCPGQGGQHAAMFARLRGDVAAEAVLAQAANVLGQRPESLAASGEAFENRHAQVLVCAAALAAWAALRADLPAPRLFAGYSVGELSAYGCAGTLTPEQTLRLARERAARMDEATVIAATLIAVRGLDRTTVEALCRQHRVEIAIVNGADHFVIGGARERIAALQAGAHARAAHVRCMPVAVAAHTSLLKQASVEFAATLSAAPLRAPVAPVLAGIDGAPVLTATAAIAALAAQVSTTINWAACMQAAYEMGARVFLELGPGAALTRMISEAYPDVAARSLEDFRSLAGARAWLERQIA
jgi:[acyl-carrier-protein] S-malonyltransferase